MTLRLLAILSFAAALAITGDEGVGLDPFGGTANIGAGIDPNGGASGASLRAIDNGAGLDPDMDRTAVLRWRSRIMDPNGCRHDPAKRLIEGRDACGPCALCRS